MERVQVPLPKQAACTRLHSCFSPPHELSPQYPAPPHHSSQALFWKNSSNAHQDLTHQASPWPPHSSRRLLVTGLETLNENASNNGLSPVSPLLEAALENATGPTLLLDECAGMDKMKSFSQPLHSVPFSCKLNLAAAKSRNTLCASLSAHIAEGVDRIPGAEDSGSYVMKVVDKPNGGSEGNAKCLSEVENVALEAESKSDSQKQRNDAEVAPSSSSVHTGIGLKLGKRTYFGDGFANGVVDGSNPRQSAVAMNVNNCDGNGGTTVGGGVVSGNAKKPKASPPAANVPRCQAEDCRMDLSGAKDYHRRHKVCEWHSKSSKAKVSNMDQRFCQQCSRFHVLSEFDEGKRSCRRRLAGHNERRRKQQPEPFSLLSAASYAYLAGAKHFLGAPPLDHPYILNHDLAGADFKELKLLQKPKDEPSANYPALELHQFLQGPLREEERHLLLGGSAQAFLMSNGSHMNLGRPPAALTSLAACLSPDHHPEALVSGRALSLLSSSLGFPNPSYSVSTSPSLEGNLVDIQHAVTSSQQIMSRASCLNLDVLKDNDMLRLTRSHEINVLSDSESANISHCLHGEQVQPSTMLAFVGSSNFSSLPGSDIKRDAAAATAAPPVLDLMQASFGASPPPSSNQVEHQFTHLEGLSIFGRQSLI